MLCLPVQQVLNFALPGLAVYNPGAEPLLRQRGSWTHCALQLQWDSRPYSETPRCKGRVGSRTVDPATWSCAKVAMVATLKVNLLPTVLQAAVVPPGRSLRRPSGNGCCYPSNTATPGLPSLLPLPWVILHCSTGPADLWVSSMK